MLVLEREEGEWAEITHRSGDVLRIKVCKINSDRKPPRVNLVFEDDDRNFNIERPERKPRPTTTGA